MAVAPPEPVAAEPTPEPEPEVRAAIARSGPHDAAILAVLASSVIGEPVRNSFERKEAELAALFGALDPIAAGALSKRLTAPVDSDPTASAFALMISERRTRLLAILVRISRTR